MNIKDNKRKKESQEKIEKIFVELIQTKEINEISVTDICKKANLNRTTFYSNYIDIYDLSDKIKEKILSETNKKARYALLNSLEILYANINYSLELTSLLNSFELFNLSHAFPSYRCNYVRKSESIAC